jgi:hypothetical protein
MLELELRMRELRAESFAWWMSVVERYVVCERRPRAVLVKEGRPVRVACQEILGLVSRTDLNHRGTGVSRALVESWSERAVESDWLAGVAWLATVFTGPLELPSEMIDRHAA